MAFGPAQALFRNTQELEAQAEWGANPSKPCRMPLNPALEQSLAHRRSNPRTGGPAGRRPFHAQDVPDHFLGWSHNQRPIDSVRVRPVLETSTRVLALMRGEIDSTDSYLPTDQVERVDRNPRTRVARDESMRVFILRMNNRKPPFDNRDARLCFAHAFNYQGFNEVILKGLVIRNAGPNPNNLWGNPPDLQPYTFDLNLARQHCDRARAAGAPIGREIQIHVQTELEQTVQAAQMFQADLRRIGVNLKIVPDTWASTRCTSRTR